MSDWPAVYNTLNDPKNVGPPTWKKMRVLQAGRMIALKFAEDYQFALDYLAIVKDYYSDPARDLTARYHDQIVKVYTNPDTPDFNASDFANVHRATWLYMLERFACLVDKNPHGDWGDPPASGVSRGEEDRAAGAEFYHNIPNGMGFYSVSSTDVPPPPIDPR